MNIIIPMSGIGERFLQAGYTTPKPLIDVEGKPIIQHIIERFSPEDNFIFICNQNHLETTELKKTLLKITRNQTILEIPQHKFGPVYAILQASTHINDDEPYIVNYCDFSWRWNYGDFKIFLEKSFCDGCVVTYKGFHPHLLGPNSYASLRTDGNKALEIREKHSFTLNKMNSHQSSGTYYFRRGSDIKKYFQHLIDKKLNLNGEYYVSMAYQPMIEDHQQVLIYEIPYFLQWGTPEDLSEYLGWSDYFKKN